MGRIKYGEITYTGLEAKYIGFVKPRVFERDSEYRMLWPTGQAEIAPVTIKVPEVAGNFRRIS